MERQADAGGGGGKTRLTFSQKWGDDPFTQSGHTQVPNALIAYAHRLGLRSEECWLITCILRFKYDASNPSPSQERLAELFGQSVDTVQRTVKKIVDKKLLKVERVRDEETHRFTHTVYDFTPLRFALNECHYQDHPDERPHMPVRLEKPAPQKATPQSAIDEVATPQKCGLGSEDLNNESHTAKMRHGFSEKPHRRSAAWSTPQICGVDIRNKKNINVQETRALNVRAGEVGESSAPETETSSEKRPTLNAVGKGIYAIRDQAVAHVVALTGDESSQRRFEQLWEIAERNGSLDAWQAAVRAVQRRLRPSSGASLERPGAYFGTVCVQELEKRQVFVPTTAEKHAEAGIAERVRESLFESAELERGEIPTHEDHPSLPAQVLPIQERSGANFAPKPEAHELNARKPNDLDTEVAELEELGGAVYEAFLRYLTAERAQYESELGGMKPALRQRLLAAFDCPEKRLNIYRRWKAATSIDTEGPHR